MHTVKSRILRSYILFACMVVVDLLQPLFSAYSKFRQFFHCPSRKLAFSSLKMNINEMLKSGLLCCIFGCFATLLNKINIHVRNLIGQQLFKLLPVIKQIVEVVLLEPGFCELKIVQICYFKIPT